MDNSKNGSTGANTLQQAPGIHSVDHPFVVDGFRGNVSILKDAKEAFTQVSVVIFGDNLHYMRFTRFIVQSFNAMASCGLSITPVLEALAESRSITRAVPTTQSDSTEDAIYDSIIRIMCIELVPKFGNT